MKKILIYLMLLLPGFILSGCETYELGNPPASTVADFTYEVSNNGYAPCTVTFTNTSLNAAGYSWDFGNGQTSNEANPVISFDTPGLYTVTLTCTPENDVHYNKLIKTLVVNIKDPMAGLTQVMYYTMRTPEGGSVHMVILTDDAPLVQDFEPVELSRPYGLAIDTAHSKVYVSDYSLGIIYRFDADGKNPVRILDYAVPGQEIVDSPEALMVVGDKLYWGRPGGIYRCNLDGTSPEVYISTEGTVPEYPIDMQYDEVTGKIYLVNDRTDYTGGYFTCDFTGAAMTEVIPDIDGTAIEVDTEANKVYMAVYPVDGTAVTEGGIYICNTDGSGLAKIGDYGSKATWGMTIDHERNKLFWGYKISNSNPDGKIIRSNLDGSGQEDWLTGVSPHAMQVTWIKL
jgi:PKD repeat protein